MQTVQNRFLSAYLRNLAADMERAVQTAPDNSLFKENQDSFINALIEKYSPIPLQLHLDQREITTQQKTIYARDLSPNMRFGRGINPHDPRAFSQTVLTCHIPYSGDATLLGFDPSFSNRLSLPEITIENSEICFEVMMNDHNPDESTQLIKTYSGFILQQVGFINSDLAMHNIEIKKHVQRTIEQKSQSVNRKINALTKIGIPLRKTSTQETSPIVSPQIIPIIDDKYYTAAISFGSLDENAGTQVNAFLETHGVKTWFYPKSSLPGQKLHRMMTNMIHQADRIVLLCSRSSLQRNGVLNELELTLAREAKEGGSDLLIPIALDDYVINEWQPQNADHAIQVRNRNIFKIDREVESDNTKTVLNKLLLALLRQ